MKKKNLGYMLLEANLIDEIQMKIALEEQKRTGKRFGSTLVELNFIDENVLAAFLSRQLDIPCINLSNIQIPAKVVEKLPKDVAYACLAVPIKEDRDNYYVAMVDPTDIQLISKLEEQVQKPVIPYVAPQSTIEHVLDKLYAHQPSEETAEPNPILEDFVRELETSEFLETRFQKLEDSMKRIEKLLQKILKKLGD